jgi:hypothetical protein
MTDPWIGIGILACLCGLSGLYLRWLQQKMSASLHANFQDLLRMHNYHIEICLTKISDLKDKIAALESKHGGDK